MQAGTARIAAASSTREAAASITRDGAGMPDMLARHGRAMVDMVDGGVAPMAASGTRTP